MTPTKQSFILDTSKPIRTLQFNTQSMINGSALPIFVHICNLLSANGINVNDITDIKFSHNKLELHNGRKITKILIVQSESEVWNG